ncbi:hypothetical protein J3E71DRAFT_357524 [Bipolaris maydis]|nr:hypothetical protein J3E71DRAFT_357524 [Bipolaris maydis]
MSDYSYQSLANMGPQGRWRRVLLVAMVPMVLAFVYYSTPSSYMPAGLSSSPYPHTQNVTLPPDDLTMSTIIKALYGPVLHPIDAPEFTDEDGDVYRLPGAPRYKSKLGKKVLILDIDSRPLKDEGQLMNKHLKWKGMRSLSAVCWVTTCLLKYTVMTTSLSAHSDYEDRWGTWVKVPLMKEALKTHEYIVFMDSDVMFHYPHLPLEWLLNYWNMTDDTLAMMSIDPNEPQNYDSRGNRYLNTGFVIARQSKRTQEMYKAWAECPSETRYKGCAKWKKGWAHEQAAFGNYLRYDYDRNGAPEAEKRGGCKGVFVRHFWVDKGLVAKSLADNVMQYFLPRLHETYLASSNEHIVDAKGYRLEGAELIEMTDAEKEAARKGKGKNQKDEGW